MLESDLESYTKIPLPLCILKLHWGSKRIIYGGQKYMGVKKNHM